MADVEFCVRVVDTEGRGLPDIPVSVFYPLSYSDQVTNESGYAYFERNLIQKPQGEPRLKVKVVASFNHSKETFVGDGETIVMTI